MALSSTQLQDIGLPLPDASGLKSEGLIEAFQDFVQNLQDLGQGAYSTDAWPRFQLTSDSDLVATSRLALFCWLAPFVMGAIHELWEREGLEGEPEQHSHQRLGAFGKLLEEIHSIQASDEFKSFISRLPVDHSAQMKGKLGARPGSSRALAGFNWTVREKGATWAGQCYAWPFGDRWCLITASWETPDFSYTPVLLGFARRHGWHRSIGRVLANTVGRFVGPEPSVSTYFGFSGFEVAFIATSLHGAKNEDWENPLEELQDEEILEAFELRGRTFNGMRGYIDGLRAVQEAQNIVQQTPGNLDGL